MIIFSDKQREFITMPRKHFLEVCEGTPRSGKTFAATMRYAMHIIATEDRTHMVVAYSTEQAYRLIIEGEGYGLKYIFDGFSRMKHDDSGAHLEVDTPTGIKKVYWKGGGKEDSKNVITGMSLGSAYLCEINLLNMGMIQEVFRRTYAAKDRYVIADLNPPPPNDPVITDVFNIQDTYWTHWTAKDNPTLTPERLEELRITNSKSPFLWKRDWLGERCMPEGVVYWMFDQNKHVLSELPDNIKKERMFLSGDGGTTDATSIICWIVGKTEDGYKLYQVGNYYYDMKQKALSTQAKDIVGDFIPYMRNKYGMKEQGIYIDPACKALTLEIQKLGLPAMRADNNARDVKNSSKGIKCGIEMLQSSITENRFFLVDDKRFGVEPAIKEMGLYCMDKRGNPVDAYNHWCDSARYGHNHFAKNYGYWYGAPRATER